jgi:alpha-1,3-rhamnosyl/mannosyltransferase
MALRVGFNATPLAAPLTGIGNYILHLGAALSASGEVDLYSFYGNRWVHETPRSGTGATHASFAARMRDLAKPWIPFKRGLSQARQRLTFGRGVRRHGIELYHEPNYVALPTAVPSVTTIHDLSWLRYPETHPRDRVRWLERAMPGTLSRVAAILVDSEFVRNEVLAAFGVDPSRIHVVPLGVAEAFRPRVAGQTVASLQALGLTHGCYLLTVGTIEPRKNVGHVLDAYAGLPARLRARYPLVVAGAIGWRAKTLERQLQALASRGEIRFLGRVADDDLPCLYAGAAAFVFPSLYEGFGLPPLEAMASGVPVLVSDRASMPEIAGGAAMLLDPGQSERTAACLEAVLEDAERRAAMVERGLRRAAAFTWEACAVKTLDVYRAVLRATK